MRYLDLVTDGTRAMVDGLPIEVPVGSDPAQALIAYVQQLAAAQGNLLVHVRDNHGTDTWLHIKQDGTLEQAHPPTSSEPALPQPEVLPPTELSSWTSDGEAAPVTARVRPFGNVDISRRAALMAGGSVVGLLALGGGVWALASRENHAAAPAPSSPSSAGKVSANSWPEGQYPPAGWSGRASWVVSRLADARPQVAVRDGLVVVKRQQPGSGVFSITVLSADTGHTLWEQGLATEVVTHGPYLIKRSSLLVMIATKTKIQGWDAHSGKLIIDEKLPHQGVSVGFSALGPWVAEEGSRYRALRGTALVPFDLPANSTCYGTVGDELLVVGTDARVWKLASGKPTPRPASLEAPDGMSAGGPVLVTARLLVMAWLKDEGMALRAYDVKSLKTLWTTSIQEGWNASMAASRVAPDQSWATVANRRVNLGNGQTSVIASTWNPQGISDTHAWGDDGTYVLTCNKNGKLLDSKPTHAKGRTALVVGGTSECVLLAAGAAGNTTLYAAPLARE